MGLSLSFMGASCSVKIKDQEWCGDMGAQGATCFHTLRRDTRDIPLEQWNQERFGQVCTDPRNFADLKSNLEKLCHQTKNCVYIDRTQNFFNHIEAMTRVRSSQN